MIYDIRVCIHKCYFLIYIEEIIDSLVQKGEEGGTFH